MTLIQELYGIDGRIAFNAPLGELVQESIDTSREDIGHGGYHFWVTDLVNPAQVFWKEQRPDVKRTHQVAGKLALGKRIQLMAHDWFGEWEDYIYEEAPIDGAWKGLHGVVGKLDYRLGDSIIELKSKTQIPNSIQEVFEFYPNDLEQLLFYVVMIGLEKKDHFLVFVTSTRPTISPVSESGLMMNFLPKTSSDNE